MAAKKNNPLDPYISNSPPTAGLAEGAESRTVHVDPKDYLPKVIMIPMMIRGLPDLPIIVNNFSDKGREQMRLAQQQKARAKRAPKDPLACFEGAKYRDKQGRECIPAAGIRNAMIQAARMIEGITMVSLKQAIFVEGLDGPAQTLLPLEFDRCEMVEDVVRNDNEGADLRYRPYYYGWKIRFRLYVVENAISVVQAHQLLAMAGFSVGLCEWRPAGKTGMGGPYGRFEIAQEAVLAHAAE